MCDVKGCWRLPYCEVYPFPRKGRGWSYLCKKHFREEFKKYGLTYGWVMLDWYEVPSALWTEFRCALRKNKNDK